jgi:hypothetical protein
MGMTYRRYTINCDPQLLADGGYSSRLVVTEHQNDVAIDHIIDLGAHIYQSAQEASQVAASAGMRWVDAKIGPVHLQEQCAALLLTLRAAAPSYRDAGRSSLAGPFAPFEFSPPQRRLFRCNGHQRPHSLRQLVGPSCQSPRHEATEVPHANRIAAREIRCGRFSEMQIQTNQYENSGAFWFP